MERLELPVGPPSEVPVGCVGNLSDLSHALVSVEAGTELAHEERYTESLCVFSSSGNSLFVPPSTSLGICCLRLAGLSADVKLEATAVSVVIEHVVW